MLQLYGVTLDQHSGGAGGDDADADGDAEVSDTAVALLPDTSAITANQC